MKSRNNNSLYELFTKWKANHQALCQFIDYLCDFWYVWGILVLLGIGLLLPFDWKYGLWISRIFIVLLTVLFLLRPMNAVYGLMGTSGSIRIFFINFVIITLIFSSIYYFGFFKGAGITYDSNQPHIDYQMFYNSSKSQNINESVKRDTVYLIHQLDSKTYTEKIIRITDDKRNYQKIDFYQVWRSTILTTLTQEAADLFTIASVHNEAINNYDSDMNKEKSYLFEWILIFHIIISWIFFGVFISLLYNKFRYES